MKKTSMIFEALSPVTRRNYGVLENYGKIEEGGNTDLRKEKVMDGKLTNGADHGGLKIEFDASTKPTMAVDVERYQRYLDDTDLTEAEKKEFLQALWNVIISFVELGFGVHPLQEVCGKDAGIDTESAEGGLDALVLDKPNKDENVHGASPEDGLEME